VIWLYTLLVFLMGVGVDVAFIWWARSTQKLRFWHVVASATFIQVFSNLGLLFIVSEPMMLVANAAGHAVGSGLGVAIAMRSQDAEL
jgi:hypothetical protein